MVLTSISLLSGSQEIKKGQLTFKAGLVIPSELTYFRQVLQGFQQETGIEVTALVGEAKTSEEIRRAFLDDLKTKKSDPDVMFLDIAWISELADDGLLEELDNYQIDTTVFFPKLVKLADTYNGKLIALPGHMDGGLLYYRQDLLQKYGYQYPPKTWDELLAMSLRVQAGERATNPDFWGFVWQGSRYEGLVCNALEYFVSAGGGFVDEKGDSIINKEENVIALQFMVDLIHQSRISPPTTYQIDNEEQVWRRFQEGNALFERNWPFAWGKHNAADSPVKGKVGIAPLPSFPNHDAAATLGGWHFAISKYSDRKEDAVKLLNYLTSYNVQKNMVQTIGWNSVRRDIYSDPQVVASAPHLISLRSVFDNAVPRPMVPYYPDFSLVLQKYIHAALSKAMLPADALQKAHEELKVVKQKFEKS